MAQVNTTTTLSGLFKIVYGEDVVNLLPDFAKLVKMIPFREREKIGDQYQIPVKLQHEHGFTYGAAGDGAYTLNSPIAGFIGKALVQAFQITERSQLDYESAFKAANGGERAFRDATEVLVENMVESFAKRLELSMLYGQQGLGQVLSNTAGALVITTASWAPGIWSGMKDCILEAFDSQAATANQHNGDLTVTSVDITTRTITVSGTSAAVVANDFLYYKGSRTTTAHKEMAGLDKIILNTGTLFNIDAASYELWRGNTYNVGGAISFNKIQQAISQAVAMGLNEKVAVLLAPSRWATLNTDLAALRMLDSSYNPKEGENGFESLMFHSVSGPVEIISHPFVKEGEGFILPLKRIKRVGATDVTFKRPGRPDEIFVELPSNNGYELRQYCNQSVFIEAPAMCVKLTGITS